MTDIKPVLEDVVLIWQPELWFFWDSCETPFSFHFPLLGFFFFIFKAPSFGRNTRLWVYFCLIYFSHLSLMIKITLLGAMLTRNISANPFLMKEKDGTWGLVAYKVVEEREGSWVPVGLSSNLGKSPRCKVWNRRGKVGFENIWLVQDLGF